MTIDNQKVVSVTYELSINDFGGDVVETVKEEKPLTFLFGVGNMLETFEENIKGLNPGDDFKFKIDCDNAYGKANEEAIVDLPKNIFEVEGKIPEDLLKVGNYIPMQDQEGNKLDGIVLEVSDDQVKMDFNHPLAGDDLFFKGKVVEVREPSDEELNQGHANTSAGE